MTRHTARVIGMSNRGRARRPIDLRAVYDTFRNVPKLAQYLIERHCQRELQPDRCDCARGRQVHVSTRSPTPGKPHESLEPAAELHAEPRDFGEPARDQRGARVVAEPEPVADAGGDRHHVLERARDFDADDVVARLQAQRIFVIQLTRHLLRAIGIRGLARRQRRWQTARNFAAKLGPDSTGARCASAAARSQRSDAASGSTRLRIPCPARRPGRLTGSRPVVCSVGQKPAAVVATRMRSLHRLVAESASSAVIFIHRGMVKPGR